MWELLQSDAVVSVCGNAATMAPGVRAAVPEVFRAKTATSDADAQVWFIGLRAGGAISRTSGARTPSCEPLPRVGSRRPSARCRDTTRKGTAATNTAMGGSISPKAVCPVDDDGYRSP